MRIFASWSRDVGASIQRVDFYNFSHKSRYWPKGELTDGLGPFFRVASFLFGSQFLNIRIACVTSFENTALSLLLKIIVVAVHFLYNLLKIRCIKLVHTLNCFLLLL